MERHSKLYRKWVRSMLLVVAAILSVVLILCLYLVGEIRSNTLRTSSDMSEYLRQNLDSRLQEIQINSAFFELNNINSKLKTLEEAPETTQQIYQYIDQLGNYRTSASLVDNLYIYYGQTDYVLGSYGFYPADTYHTIMHLRGERDHGELRPELNSESTYFVSYEYGEGYLLFYVRPMMYKKQAVGAIVMEINQEELLRNGTVDDEIGSLAVYGIAVDGALIANSADEAISSGFEQLLRENDYHDTTIEYEGVLSYVRDSYYPGVQYIAGYEQTSLYSGIYTATLVSALGMLLCLVLGIISSLRISRTHAKPVEKLLQQMGPPTGDDAEDEYQYITQRVDQLLHDSYKSEEKLKEQQKSIDTLFISMVLNGQMQDEYAVFTAAQRYDVLFENPVYQVAVIETGQDISAEYSDEIFTWLENDARGEDFMVARLGPTQVVVLFNPEEPHGRDFITLLMGNLLTAVFEGIAAACGVGRGHDSMADIFTSYTEALGALPEVPAEGHSVAFYAPIARKNANTSGVAATEHFTHHLWAGRYQSAADMLEAVGEEYLAPQFAPEVLEMRMAGLKSIMVNELEKLRADGQDINYSAQHERVRKASTPEELIHAFGKILLSISNVQKENAGRDMPVPERAREIIGEKLCDPMLGLYLISEQLQVSNTYLSTSFKARYGVGVVQYINEQRIEKAKKLILTTDISIKEIAETVGFTSDISFIRVFKRYERKTPASLRKGNAAG